MKHTAPDQRNNKTHETGIIEKLKSISILAWLNLFFVLMIITMLLFPDILPQSKREREWNSLLNAANAPLLSLEEVEAITPQLTFAQILHVLPEAEATLNGYGLLCGTCSIAQYETVEMASRVYEFDMQRLVKELDDLLKKKRDQLQDEADEKSP